MESTNEYNLPDFLINAFDKFLNFYEIDKDDVNFDVCIAADINRRYDKDVARLTQYHKMEGINARKIAGYLTYWITKLRPISIANYKLYLTRSELCLYINEAYAFYAATGCLISAEKIKDIRTNADFLESFFYQLKYRQTTGDNLALIYHLMDN